MTTEQSITLAVLARESLAAKDGDAAKAIAHLVLRLRRDKALLCAVVKDAIETAVYIKVNEGIRKDRQSIILDAHRTRFESHMPSSESRKSSVIALAGGIAASHYLDFPMAGGLKLRDASHSELGAQINAYEKQAYTQLHRSRWLRLIMREVPDNKKVGDVLSEQRVAQLWEQAKTADSRMPEAAE